MRTKVLFAAMVIVAVVMVFASPAMAGQVTRIAYGLENVAVYEYTPTQTGTLDISISWTDEWGNASVYPISEVDGVVQMYDSASKENYMDVDVASLYAGTNPQVGSKNITTQLVNKPVYISVVPWVGDCQFRIVVTFRGATVIDQTGMAYGHSGEFFMPATAAGGTWLSVMQTWPGTLNRAGASDVYANWDDYVYELDPSGSGVLADAWAVDTNSYVAPLRTETPINGTDGIADRWYVVGPEIWTGAARPNVWTNIATDLFPKPGNVAYNGAPLWYTYSWTDTAKADAPAYLWGLVATTTAAGHSFSSIGDRSTELRYSFYGTSVKWVYTKFNRGGIAQVRIDGVDKGTVDQYNATVLPKQSSTFGGLTNAAHEIVITSTATRNGSSLGYWTTHDRFEAKGFATDTQLISEDNSDGMTTSKWGTVNNAGASGGSFAAIGDRAAALAFTFSGTSIDWKYTKFNRGGNARVYIDGVDKGTVDQYSASFAFQQTATFSGLPAGLHTILIVSDKTRNGSSLGYWTTHDAFVVGGTPVEN